MRLITALIIFLSIIGITQLRDSASPALAACDPRTCWACCDGCGGFCANPTNGGCAVENASCTGSSTSSTSTSSSGCSNSVLCNGTTVDYTYNAAGVGSCFGCTDTLPTWTHHKTIGINASPTANTCSPKWPTWTNTNGQDDLIWHTYSGNVPAYIYSHIPMAGHPIAWNDALIIVHTYINNNATMCGAVYLYKCYGALNISANTYSKDGNAARFSSLTVTGTAVYAQTGTAGNTIVGCE